MIMGTSISISITLTRAAQAVRGGGKTYFRKYITMLCYLLNIRGNRSKYREIRSNNRKYVDIEGGEPVTQ